MAARIHTTQKIRCFKIPAKQFFSTFPTRTQNKLNSVMKARVLKIIVLYAVGPVSGLVLRSSHGPPEENAICFHFKILKIIISISKKVPSKMSPSRMPSCQNTWPAIFLNVSRAIVRISSAPFNGRFASSVGYNNRARSVANVFIQIFCSPCSQTRKSDIVKSNKHKI